MKFSDFVKFPLKCFKFFGLTPHEPTNTIKKRLLRIYHYVQLLILTSRILCTSVFIKQNITNLTIITENIPPNGYICVTIAKSIAILHRASEFSDLFATLSDLFPKTKVEQETLKVKEYLRGYKLTERIFSTMVGLSALNFIFLTCVAYFTTGVFKLPFKTWTPFDQCDPKYFWLVFLWQFNNTIMVIISLLGSDLIFFAFITILTMQFDILSLKLRELKGDSFNKKSFIELVKLHETLIRLAEDLEKIYSFSFLVNFSGSSILICLIGYQVSIGVSVDNFTKFTILLLASLSQVAILCYYGEKLSSASEKVAEAAYDSGWIESDDKGLQVGLLLMIQRSQKYSYITAYKFSRVSLKAYAAVSRLKMYFECHLKTFASRFSIHRFRTSLS